MEIILDQKRRQVLADSVRAMAEFKATFGRGLSGDFVAELYAADALGLKVVGLNQSGYDALGPGGERYQVKFRSAGTPIVDVNNFDFDYLLLVNLNEDYQLLGMWRITATQAKDIFVNREKFHKYQATQAKIKRIGEHLSAGSRTSLDVEKTDVEKTLSTPTQTSTRRWRDIRGAAAHPLLGEDAQSWVSRSRRQDDEQDRLTP